MAWIQKTRTFSRICTSRFDSLHLKKVSGSDSRSKLDVFIYVSETETDCSSKCTSEQHNYQYHNHK